jgi:hypothetical protein
VHERVQDVCGRPVHNRECREVREELEMILSRLYLDRACDGDKKIPDQVAYALETVERDIREILYAVRVGCTEM